MRFTLPSFILTTRELTDEERAAQRTPEIGDCGSVRDDNGNRVGSWHIDNGENQ